VKALRSFLLSLLISLLVGLAIGMWLRWRLEQPVGYIGSAPAALPHDVGYARAVVLDPGQHEEQVAQAIQVA
jgi:hypothetical protein